MTLPLMFHDTWLPLEDGTPLIVNTEPDDVTREAVLAYDFEWSGTSSFLPVRKPDVPADFSVGVIVGASGSGKTTLLREFGVPSHPAWDDRPIAAAFATAGEAAEKFYAVGLNSVPTWTRPYSVLSTGERFRADLARVLGTGTVVDEFTSVVDRHVAMSASNALRRWAADRRIVVATCHRDVLPWLNPDWVIDLDTREWSVLPRDCLQRPNLVVEVREAKRSAWDIFRRHHYLNDGPLHPFARCYLATIDNLAVGFSATIPFPNGHLRNAWRGHRTVVLPDYQGLGIGVRLSDFVAALHLKQGLRYFSRTSHPLMGRWRDASPRWRATTSNHTRRRALARFGFNDEAGGTERDTWSHEYVGSDKP